MTEQSVFWLGGRPGTQQAAQAPPAAAALEPALRQACRDCGVEPGEFVAALGGHGSWLLQFSRGERPERLVWNGRDGRLVVQRALRTGGWEDLRDCALDPAQAAAPAVAIAALLRQDSPTSGG